MLEVGPLLRFFNVVWSLHSIAHLVIEDEVAFGVVLDLVPIIVQKYLIALLVVLLEGVALQLLHRFAPLVLQHSLAVLVHSHQQSFFVVPGVFAGLVVDDYSKAFGVEEGDLPIEVLLNGVAIAID